jgi:hypothetical protein
MDGSLVLKEYVVLNELGALKIRPVSGSLRLKPNLAKTLRLVLSLCLRVSVRAQDSLRIQHMDFSLEKLEAKL